MNQVNYTTFGTISYSSGPRAKLENLRFNIIYDIKIIPFRKNEDVKELAIPYETLRVKTGCSGKWTN